MSIKKCLHFRALYSHELFSKAYILQEKYKGSADQCDRIASQTLSSEKDDRESFTVAIWMLSGLLSSRKRGMGVAGGLGLGIFLLVWFGVFFLWWTERCSQFQIIFLEQVIAYFHHFSASGGNEQDKSKRFSSSPTKLWFMNLP